jgi:hypothetical protein
MERVGKIPHRVGHGEKQTMVDIFKNVKLLSLKLTDCQKKKSNFYRKSSSARFEGNGRI